MAVTENLGKYLKQIGIMFKLARESQGWTVEQVATMADLQPAKIEKIEAGEFSYSFYVLTLVADVLGYKVIIKEKE